MLGFPLTKRVNNMKKQFKTILIPLISVSLLGIATASYADRGGCDYRGGAKGAYGQKFDAKGGPDKGMRMERLAQKLGLTDTQKDKVSVIFETSRDEHQALRDSMQNNRKALHQAMGSDNAASVRSLAEQKGDLVTEMTVLRANKRSQIMAVLTPEQQEAFAQMKKHRRGRH